MERNDVITALIGDYMRNTLYEFHLLKDGLYSKQYFREKTTQELKQKIEELRKQGYEILSVEVN